MGAVGAGGEGDGAAEDIDLGDYCRSIEAHLSMKNHGRLIRIAGPTFDRVRGWAARGIPLTIVLRGVDRAVDRYTARGPRRRPVLLDFCEADVLDVFDEWRRAVGVRAAALPGGEEEDAGEPRASGSLPAHLERVIARLTALRATQGIAAEWSAELERAARELDSIRAAARGLRGEARKKVIGRLEQIDLALVQSARARCRPEELAAVEKEAASELRPFEPRMSPEDFRHSLDAAIDRLVRERAGIPTISYGF